MWKHYLKVAWRNLKRSKIFSLINIIGLTVGLTCAMLILLFVKDEGSFDRFHENQHIYRLTTEGTYKGETRLSSITGILEGPKFANNVPGVKAFVRFHSDGTDFKKGTEVQALNLLRADPNFFQVFSFPLLAGNPATCLDAPNAIVLSEDEAIRQFGSKDVIGKTIQIKEDTLFKPYVVTAVAKNCPENSSIRFNALAKFRSTPEAQNNPENWFNSYINTFIVLSDHANPVQVEKQIQRFYVKDASASFKALIKQFGIPESEISMDTYHLQALADMHLDKRSVPVTEWRTAATPFIPICSPASPCLFF